MRLTEAEQALKLRLNNLNGQRESAEENESLRIVRINLDEQVILETDKSGNELLRLEIICDGVPIRVRFPTYGNYDDFTKEVAALFSILSRFADNFAIPQDWVALQDKDELTLWLTLAACTVRHHQASKLIERIFVKYLRPEIAGLQLRLNSPRTNQRRRRRWIRAHVGVDVLVRMFAAIVAVDQWVKKNTLFVLKEIYRLAIPPLSSPTSTKNGDIPPEKLGISQSFSSVSF